jgi:hypothetical protein
MTQFGGPPGAIPVGGIRADDEAPTATFLMPDGSVISFVDFVDDIFTGSLEVQTGDSTKIDALGVGSSDTLPGGGRPQTDVDSNLPRSGSMGLNDPYEQFIYAICLDVVRQMRAPAAGTILFTDAGTQLSDPAKPHGLWAINRGIYWSFRYNDKDLRTGTLYDFPAGRGAWYGGTENNVGSSVNGSPTPASRSALSLPIHMVKDVKFAMRAMFPAALVLSEAASDSSTALTYADIRVSLVGPIRVPVK